MTLVYAGRPEGAPAYQLSGVVTDVIEDGGTCTFTLRKGAVAIQRQQPGAADATSTSCGTVEVPAAELSAGTWDASLTYTSATGTGSSATSKVVVP